MAELLNRMEEKTLLRGGIATGVAAAAIFALSGNDPSTNEKGGRQSKEKPCSATARSEGARDVEEALHGEGILVGKVGVRQGGCVMEGGKATKFNTRQATGKVEGTRCTVSVVAEKSKSWGPDITWKATRINKLPLEKFASKVHNIKSPSGEEIFKKAADPSYDATRYIQREAQRCL